MVCGHHWLSKGSSSSSSSSSVTSVFFFLLLFLPFPLFLLLHQKCWKRRVSTLGSSEMSQRLTQNCLPTSEHIPPDVNAWPNSILPVIESQHPQASAQMSTSSSFYTEMQSLVTLHLLSSYFMASTWPVFTWESSVYPHWNVSSVRTWVLFALSLSPWCLEQYLETTPSQ